MSFLPRKKERKKERKKKVGGGGGSRVLRSFYSKTMVGTSGGRSVGFSYRRNNILQSNGFYERFPTGPQLFNLPQRAYEYKYEGGGDLCRTASERVAR